MWVQYKLEGVGTLRKFSVPRTKTPPSTKTTSLGTWKLEDPKGEFEVKDLVQDIIKDQTTQLIGYAILTKDVITGFKQWATYAADGSDFTNLSPQQPLVIPVESKLQLGTRVEIRTPV